MRLRINESIFETTEESLDSIIESSSEEQLVEVLNLPSDTYKGFKVNKGMAKQIGSSGGGPTATWKKTSGLRGVSSNLMAVSADKQHHFFIQPNSWGGYSVHHASGDKFGRVEGPEKTEYRGGGRNHPSYPVKVKEPIDTQYQVQAAMRRASGLEPNSFTYHAIDKGSAKRRPESQRPRGDWRDNESGYMSGDLARKHVANVLHGNQSANHEAMKAELHKHVDNIMKAHAASILDPYSRDISKAHDAMHTALKDLSAKFRTKDVELPYDVKHSSRVKRTDVANAVRDIKSKMSAAKEAFESAAKPEAK